MKKSYLLFWLLVIILSSCKKETATAPDCTAIQQGIVTGNTELVQKEINAICKSIPVQISSTDPEGLKHSLDELVTRLSSLCSISAKSLCYFCIDTLPPQSEISVTITTTAGTVTKVIDISYNSSKQLYFVNMHD